jgi:hypothetical protein
MGEVSKQNKKACRLEQVNLDRLNPESLHHHPAFAVASRESALAILLDEFESAGANSAGVAQDEMRAWATDFADKAAGVDGGSLAISQLQYACRLELTMRQTAANKGRHDSESAVPTHSSDWLILRVSYALV